MSRNTKRNARRQGRGVLTFAITVGALLGLGTAHAANDRAVAPMTIEAMQVLGDGHGWVADGAHLLVTADAGASWREITPKADDTQQLRAIEFLDANTAWVVVERAGAVEVAVTRDGGGAWTRHALPIATTGEVVPQALEFSDDQHGWLMLRAAGSANFSHGQLLRTRDGGASWQALPTPPIAGELRFTSATQGWLVGGVEGEALYRTRDGGRSWQRLYLGDHIAGDAATQPRYLAPTFRDAKHGRVPVLFSAPERSELAFFDTSDGGKQWTLSQTVALDGDAATAGGINVALLDDASALVAPRSRDGVRVAAKAARVASERLTGALRADEAITQLSFADANTGWTLVSGGRCAGVKQACEQTTRLLLTRGDGAVLGEVTPLVERADEAQAKIVVINSGKGFDKCAAGTVSQMQAWWTNTPWAWANIYIGGSNRGCSQGNLTSSWVTSILNQGWRLVPTWVGPQAPGSVCTGCSKMSSSTATARSQGIAEANAASDRAAALGLNPQTIIYYDMERYDPTSNAAARAFVNGWVERMHQRGNRAGVYGSPANASADWAGIANPPDAVWLAAWNGNTSVFGISGISDSLWKNHQRLHQYRGDHNETWGGVTFNIDSNSADGPVADR